jgi:hypothetical protein
MLQGDANAPATMMRNMTTIFGDIIGEYVWVYLDVVVFSQSVQEHMQHLHEIFKRLQNASFYLKLSKCQLMQKSLKLLGHTIENGKIMPAPEKIRQMKWSGRKAVDLDSILEDGEEVIPSDEYFLNKISDSARKRQ